VKGLDGGREFITYYVDHISVGYFPQGTRRLGNFVKLSLTVNVMFQDTYEYQVIILVKEVCLDEAQCNRMELILKKLVTVLSLAG